MGRYNERISYVCREYVKASNFVAKTFLISLVAV